jgi:hypothetical protein
MFRAPPQRLRGKAGCERLQNGECSERVAPISPVTYLAELIHKAVECFFPVRAGAKGRMRGLFDVNSLVCGVQTRQENDGLVQTTGIFLLSSRALEPGFPFISIAILTDEVEAGRGSNHNEGIVRGGPPTSVEEA